MERWPAEVVSEPPKPDAISQPAYSSDGMWYWNGHQWVPTGRTAPIQIVQSGSSPFTSGFLACLGACAALVLVGVLALVVMGVCSVGLLSGASSSPTP